MAKKRVFVCFDYDNDKHYKYLLEAWDANSDFEFSFNDKSPDEIQSDDVSVIKSVLSRKIGEATYTLVIIGEHANDPHEDKNEIGYVNWQNFEVAKSVDYGNKMVSVKIDRTNDAPEELYGVGASWAYSFSQDSIISALEDA